MQISLISHHSSVIMFGRCWVTDASVSCGTWSSETAWVLAADADAKTDPARDLIVLELVLCAADVTLRPPVPASGEDLPPEDMRWGVARAALVLDPSRPLAPASIGVRVALELRELPMPTRWRWRGRWSLRELAAAALASPRASRAAEIAARSRSCSVRGAEGTWLPRGPRATSDAVSGTDASSTATSSSDEYSRSACSWCGLWSWFEVLIGVAVTPDRPPPTARGSPCEPRGAVLGGCTRRPGSGGRPCWSCNALGGCVPPTLHTIQA